MFSHIIFFPLCGMLAIKDKEDFKIGILCEGRFILVVQIHAWEIIKLILAVSLRIILLDK